MALELSRAITQDVKPSRMRQDYLVHPGGQRSTGLVDVLDRVLDKGLVIAGDIKISLAEVELLTIRIRLIVCSLDKAEKVGLDWWKYDPHLAPGRESLAAENAQLRKQLAALERRVAQLDGPEPVRRTKRRSADGREERDARRESLWRNESDRRPRSRPRQGDRDRRLGTGVARWH
jgi:Gas vesicle protein